MSSVSALPLPQTCRSVDDALGAARLSGATNVLILSELEDGFLILNGQDGGEPLTMAQCVYLLRKAEHVMFGPWERIG